MAHFIEPDSGIRLKYGRTPLIRTPVIRNANYPDRFGPSGKFVAYSTKLTCLEITGYRITYSTSRTSYQAWSKGLDAGLKKLRGLSPRANYTDRAAATGQ